MYFNICYYLNFFITFLCLNFSKIHLTLHLNYIFLLNVMIYIPTFPFDFLFVKVLLLFHTKTSTYLGKIFMESELNYFSLIL